MSERIETGALQIDDDWTGLFIRGDDALMLRHVLANAVRGIKLEGHDEWFAYMIVGVVDIDVNHNSEDRDVQKIKRCK